MLRYIAAETHEQTSINAIKGVLLIHSFVCVMPPLYIRSAMLCLRYFHSSSFLMGIVLTFARAVFLSVHAGVWNF